MNYQVYGNGTRTAFEYDGRGMTKTVSHHRATSYQNHSWRQYWRDERDRITAFQKSTNSVVNPMENGRGDRFRYDEEGQLIEAWYNAANPAVSGEGCSRYDGLANYDALGNRTGWKYIASRGSWMNFGLRNNGLNQYSSWENDIPWPNAGHFGTAIFYDDNSPWTPWTAFPGNGVTMADGLRTASYNALNQPVAMIPFAWSSNVLYFGYDPLGRCVKRWVGTSGAATSNPATYMYYDGWNLIEEGTGAGSTSRNYVHGARVDEIVKQLIQYNPAPRFFHYDARGHCTLQTDANGNIAEQYEYDAFGYPYFFDAAGNPTTVNGRPDSPWGNRFLFTGREWLSDVKLYDYRNRMYQPELGRFLQPDPKQFAAGDYNLYRYCHNDPVNKTDPTGLASSEIIAKIVQFLRGVKDSEKVVKEVRTMKDAVRALKEGEDVRFKSETLAREGAKQAGNGATPIKEADKFGEHYHDRGRAGGHALFSSAGILTIRDVLPPGSSGFERAGASVLDFLNPILIVNDVIDIAKTTFTPDPAAEKYPPR